MWAGVGVWRVWLLGHRSLEEADGLGEPRLGRCLLKGVPHGRSVQVGGEDDTALGFMEPRRCSLSPAPPISTHPTTISVPRDFTDIPPRSSQTRGLWVDTACWFLELLKGGVLGLPLRHWPRTYGHRERKAELVT